MSAEILVNEYILGSAGWTKLVTGLTGAIDFRALRTGQIHDATLAANGTSSSTRTITLENGLVVHINDGTYVLCIADANTHEQEWVDVADLAADDILVVFAEGQDSLRTEPPNGSRDQKGIVYQHLTVLTVANVTSGGQATKVLTRDEVGDSQECIITGGVVIKLPTS